MRKFVSGQGSWGRAGYPMARYQTALAACHASVNPWNESHIRPWDMKLGFAKTAKECLPVAPMEDLRHTLLQIRSLRTKADT